MPNGSTAAIAAIKFAVARKELPAHEGHSQLPDVVHPPVAPPPDCELVRRAMIWEIQGADSHTKERIRKIHFGMTD